MDDTLGLVAGQVKLLITNTKSNSTVKNIIVRDYGVAEAPPGRCFFFLLSSAHKFNGPNA
jgi:hypothetical protein